MLPVSVEHIELDEHGTARIAGSRSRVTNIVLDTRSGMTPEHIHKQYPHLSMAAIHAALAYYHDHRAEMDAAIETELRAVDKLRGEDEGSPTRTELTARLGRTHLVQHG